MDQHVDLTDLMPVRRIGKRCQSHRIGRNVDKLVMRRVIEMMVMIGVGVEHAVFIMDRDPTQQSGLGELVQGIVNSTERHLCTAIVYFAGQTVRRHVTVPPVKQQGSKRQTLAGRPQAGVAKPLRQFRLATRVTVILDHVNHYVQKHASLVMSCQ